MDYFNELKDKGVEAMKEHLPKVEELFENLFKGGTKTTTTSAADTTAP